MTLTVTVLEPDLGLPAEHVSNVPMRLIFNAEEEPAECFNETEDISGTIDTTKMKPVAHTQKVLFPGFYL